MQDFIKEGFTGFCKNDEHNKADQTALNQCHVEYFASELRIIPSI